VGDAYYHLLMGRGFASRGRIFVFLTFCLLSFFRCCLFICVIIYLNSLFKVVEYT
jgi:hypothetical protein